MGLLGTVPWRSGITQREDHRDKDGIRSQVGCRSRRASSEYWHYTRQVEREVFRLILSGHMCSFLMQATTASYYPALLFLLYTPTYSARVSPTCGVSLRIWSWTAQLCSTP